MKTLKILTLSLATIMLFTACANKNESIKSPFSKESIQLISDQKTYEMSDNELLENINYYNFNLIGKDCIKMDTKLYKENYGSKLAKLKNVKESELTDIDIKRFFITASAKEGLYGDKSNAKVLTNKEFKDNIFVGKYNGKYVLAAIPIEKKELFFFENEEDCYRFINK